MQKEAFLRQIALAQALKLPMVLHIRQAHGDALELLGGVKDLPRGVVHCYSGSLESAREDFMFIDRLPGRKVVLKGNHDYWWSTAAKAKRFFAENGIDTIDILYNNSIMYGDAALCGTRGWFYEEERGTEHDRKIMLREIGRLEASLKAAGDREKIAFLHYPPKYLNYECPEILEMLERYGVHECYYGHIHGKGCPAAFQGEKNGVRFRLVSADHVNFSPVKVRD